MEITLVEKGEEAAGEEEPDDHGADDPDEKSGYNTPPSEQNYVATVSNLMVRPVLFIFDIENESIGDQTKERMFAESRATLDLLLDAGCKFSFERFFKPLKE